ncbi:protein kinase [Achlya hypogyna]|uniref:Protein kinase n=1 Tax=Achlya hypogyna TaxID=1202772 RepID=A0A1V9YF21_ACHHY|nr:protein kinase [Achlya hypogyna]
MGGSMLGDLLLVTAIKLGRRSFVKQIFAAIHQPTRQVAASELTVDYANHLDKGGFGAVYKVVGWARSVKLGLQVYDVSSMQCPSPYLMQLLGVRTSPPIHLVLEFMDGGDLRGYLDKKGEAVPVEYSTLEVAWVVVNALADLHNVGPLHRDLKSQNVLLSSTSCIKVADFGSAWDDTSTMTAGVGTPHWMAPEVRAYGAKYDASVDIYWFGVIVTELNTFQVPYVDVNMPPLQMMNEVAAGRLRPSLRADCPTWLRMLATACMAHDRTQRPSAYDIV